MKRLTASVLIVSFCVMVFPLAAPITAAAQDINVKQIPQNLGTALVNIPGSVANGVKGAADEVGKRGVVAIVSGLESFILNTVATAVSTGFTLGTLGIVPPVKNAWSNDPPPFILPK